MTGAETRVNRSAQAQQDELSTLLIRAGVGFAKRHYMWTAAWLVGLILMQFATGFAVSDSQLSEYEGILETIDVKRSEDAAMKVAIAESNYYRSKGWFSCDSFCQQNYESLLTAQKLYEQIQREDAATLREAKSKVGIASEYGVQEIRDLFWGTFAKGKDFGKRSTMWDMLFASIGAMSRDENLMSFLFRVMIQLLLNFTMGMVGALIAFVWYLWDVISSYQPDPLTGLAMFSLAVISAASLVASYLIALYAATAGSAYVIVKAAGNNLRIGEGGGQRPRFIRQQQQPWGAQQQRYHYD